MLLIATMRIVKDKISLGPSLRGIAAEPAEIPKVGMFHLEG